MISQRLESFYEQLSEKEVFLKELNNKEFHSQRDLINTIESGLNGFRNLVDIKYNGLTFTYSLKHNAIQHKTSTLG